MSIADKVHINTHYTRSVNLERDNGSESVLNAYIPTSRALRTIERLTSGLHSEQAPRAWSLVGPYGSGKSSFSVFAAELLKGQASPNGKLALAKLSKADRRSAKAVSSHLAKTNGMLEVLVTGSPEPMGRRILQGLESALVVAWAGRRGKRPPVFAAIKKTISSEDYSVSSILSAFKLSQTALESAGYAGILLIIDELGKFLEYEARHYGANDIYLLQALAEHACAGHACNLFLYVMLHQSFEQYAKGLGENLKNEWSKVQGRFEEIPFIESSEQVLRVVANALEQKYTKEEQKRVARAATDSAKVLAEAEALPATLSEKEAASLFEACYPLHPVSALLLPLLCQKVAQNERTLFSYLGSHEEYGLADMLGRLSDCSDWVLPHHVFDYFVSNQSAVLGDYVTHRRWAEVITALDRLGDASGEGIAMLKTVGLMNIIGAKAGLKPSKKLLETIAGKSPTKRSLDELRSKSIITFRKFSNEYRVWQGSDFDLEEALQEALDRHGGFELADALNSEKALQPVVARRYTIRNGALRYFTPLFVDARNFARMDQTSSLPRIILFLAAGQDDEKIFFEDVVSHFSALDVICLCKNGSQLRESTAEVIALRAVGRSRQELNADPVAKREFQDRLTAAENGQDLLLSEMLECPQESQWYHKGKEKPVTNKRAFQEHLSTILEAVFSKSPTLHNELMNRDRPTSQANAARNKLLYAMFHSPELLDLGIEKFPPEKAIYRSLLLEPGLHQEKDLNKWAFCAPEKKSAYFHVWHRIDEFLASTEAEARSFADLNAELMAPPYGVKAGILPILYMAVFCTYQGELAIYENKQYRPTFTEDMIDRFVRRPDEFTVQRFRIQGLRASIYEQYKTLFSDDSEKTVVQLVRPLATLIDGLEEYTKRTKSSDLSREAIAVREAFNLSKSPEKLLFEDLPRALGFGDELHEEGSLEGYAGKLTESLRELKYAHANLVKHQQKLLAQAFHMSDELELQEIRRRAIGRYSGLEELTVDVDGLRAFIKRVSKAEGSDEEWLEGILMFLGHKPSSKWGDADRAEAEVRLSDFAKRILDLETLQLHYRKASESYDGDFEVILLKSLRKGNEPIDEVVAIDQARHDAIQDVKSQMAEALQSHTDPEMKLAILAELVDDFLVDYRKALKPTDQKKQKTGTRRAKHG